QGHGAYPLEEQLLDVSNAPLVWPNARLAYEKASETLQLLRSLPEDCLFNVISFGSCFDSLFEKSQPYSQESFSKALKHAQKMTA
ncbi:11979_t:CDS:2, partial [Racocetra persica]